MKAINLTPKKETPCKLQVIDNKRIVLSMHGFNPFSNRNLMILPKKQKNFEEEFMPEKAYCRLLKRTYQKLNTREYNSANAFFISLKLNNDLSWQKLNTSFKKFTVYLTRKYGKFEYFRAIELHKNARYHIHVVAEFEKFPADICAQKLERLWKIGKCHIIKVYDIYGVLQYLTKYKDSVCFHTKSEGIKYTGFPKRAKILVASQNFGKAIDKKHIRTIEITKEQKDRIYKLLYKNKRNQRLDKEQDTFSIIVNNFLRIEGHNYIDKATGLQQYCMDKLYAALDNDIIIGIKKILGK